MRAIRGLFGREGPNIPFTRPHISVRIHRVAGRFSIFGPLGPCWIKRDRIWRRAPIIRRPLTWGVGDAYDVVPMCPWDIGGGSEPIGVHPVPLFKTSQR